MTNDKQKSIEQNAMADAASKMRQATTVGNSAGTKPVGARTNTAKPAAKPTVKVSAMSRAMSAALVGDSGFRKIMSDGAAGAALLQRNGVDVKAIINRKVRTDGK